MSLQRAENISVSIARPLGEVYEFLAAPENFPKWASGLGHSFRAVNGGEWLAETPLGPMKVRFSAKNAYGVLDHYVIPEAGDAIYSPMRVVANDDGSEVVFTLFQRPGMSDEAFAQDAAWVKRDLLALKKLLEE
jgi:hypothetical protein